MSKLLPVDAVSFGADRPESRLRTAAIGTAHLLGALAVGALFVDAVRPLSMATHVAVASMFVVVVCLMGMNLVLGLRLNNDGLARWRLGPWYLGWATLAYGISSLTWIAPHNGAVAPITPASVVRALVVFGIAMAAWTLGYVVGPLALFIKFAERTVAAIYGRTVAELKPSLLLPWALYLAGDSARALLAALDGRIGYLGDASSTVSSANWYTQTLTSVSSLCTFATAVAAWRTFVDRRKGGLATLLPLLVLEVATGAVTGMKENFIVTGLSVLVPYGVARNKVPVRAMALMVLTFLLLVIPFNVAFRDTVRHGKTTLSVPDAVSAVPATFDEVASASLRADTASTSYEMLVVRVRMIDNLALIVQRSPIQIPYKSALDYAKAPFVGLVPRFAWPGKPVMVPGYEFSMQYYGRPSSVYTSFAVTNVGDLYMHGGLPTVLVGAVLLGFAYRLFDQIFRPERDVRALFFVLAFLPVLMKSERDVGGIIVSVPTSLFTAMIGVRLACSKVVLRRGMPGRSRFPVGLGLLPDNAPRPSPRTGTGRR